QSQSARSRSVQACAHRTLSAARHVRSVQRVQQQLAVHGSERVFYCSHGDLVEADECPAAALRQDRRELRLLITKDKKRSEEHKEITLKGFGEGRPHGRSSTEMPTAAPPSPRTFFFR